MNMFKTVLLVVLATVLTLFCVSNNSFVPVNMGFQLFNVWLPLLVLVSFALGFIPVWAWLSTDRLMLRRKVAKLEATLGRTETDLEQAKVELLRPPAPQPQVVPQPAPPGA
ncbi:LapA family protein [Sandaracinobacteroides hominis]|uniref:LapA family protein n=1 Tax=Sandaracinobacteroides hominis TaxID=2780086 RepID=UPI0018F54F12|nr:LapA family protein [Sandaracinobacteroides hominis]